LTYFLGRDSKTIPPHFFLNVNAVFLKSVIFLLVLGCASIDAAQSGYLKGHLKIISSKEVELADQTQSQASELNYADFPLIILSKDRKKEIARITADEKGDYQAALPAGDYILDVQGRVRGHLRAKPEPFTVISNQTVRVDMTIDTGVR
jgi:hypothetical protein